MANEALYVATWQSKVSRASGTENSPMTLDACAALCKTQNDLYGATAYYYPAKADDMAVKIARQKARDEREAEKRESDRRRAEAREPRKASPKPEPAAPITMRSASRYLAAIFKTL